MGSQDVESNGQTRIRVYFEGDQHIADIARILEVDGETRIYTEAGVTLTNGGTVSIGETVPLSDTAATDFYAVEYYVGDSEIADINSVNVLGQSNMAYVIPESARLAGDFYALFDDNEDLGDSYSYRANVADFQNIQPIDFSAKKIYEDQLVIENNRLTFTIADLADLQPEGLERVSLSSENSLSEGNYAGYFIDGDLLKDGAYSIDIVDFETLPEFPFDTSVTATEIATALSNESWTLSFDNGVASTVRGYQMLRLSAQER